MNTSQEAAARKLLAAVKLQRATQMPFASVEAGGLGLAYTSENLLTSAWEERAKRASEVVEAAIAAAEAAGIEAGDQ